MTVVVDASAVLTILNEEPGMTVVVEVLPLAVIGAVNISEAVAKLADGGMPGPEIQEAIEGLGLDVVPFDAELALAFARSGAYRGPILGRPGFGCRGQIAPLSSQASPRPK